MSAGNPRVRGAFEPGLRTAASNRFFRWPAEAAAPVEFDPASRAADGETTDLRFFHGLALELSRAFPDGGVTFLLTWHLDAFDERFRDAVVVLIGDEKYQVPDYAPAVRAVFKTGGTTRNPLRSTLRLPPAIAWRVLLRDARNALLARRRRSAGRPGMFEVPMGSFGLTDTPFVPFAERSVDVFFAGSIEPTSGFTLRPRLAARRQMLEGLELTRRRLPRLRVDCTRSGPFANPGDMLGPAAYSARLMQAKIALCPRGNFDETFRLVEAAKSGCVAIVEQLPERWYNHDSPAIAIERWSALPEVVESLLADPEALAQRGDQMRRWWNECLSETAVADFIVRTLRHA
jgi:hypothetical protein